MPPAAWIRCSPTGPEARSWKVAWPRVQTAVATPPYLLSYQIDSELP